MKWQIYVSKETTTVEMADIIKNWAEDNEHALQDEWLK